MPKTKLESAHKVSSFFSLRRVGKGRSVIVYGVDLMNPQTANALLKTIEEPPENSHFFMITSQLGKVLPTIRSRCQVIQLSPLAPDELRRIHPSAPEWAYYSAQGRADLLGQLSSSDDQAHRQGHINAFYSAMNPTQPLGQIKEWLGDRENTVKLLETWQQLVRDIMFVKGDLHPIVHIDQKAHLSRYAKWPTHMWDDLFQDLGQLRSSLEYNVDRQLALETLLYEFRHQLSNEV